MLAVQERHARRARIDGNRAQPSGAECSAQRDLSLETADLQVGIAEVVPDIGSRQPIRRFDDPVGAAEQHAGNRSAHPLTRTTAPARTIRDAGSNKGPSSGWATDT
jgi:hypothetical protein